MAMRYCPHDRYLLSGINDCDGRAGISLAARFRSRADTPRNRSQLDMGYGSGCCPPSPPTGIQAILLVSLLCCSQMWPNSATSSSVRKAELLYS
jgi:hypothetical protein